MRTANAQAQEADPSHPSPVIPRFLHLCRVSIKDSVRTQEENALRVCLSDFGHYIGHISAQRCTIYNTGEYVRLIKNLKIEVLAVIEQRKYDLHVCHSLRVRKLGLVTCGDF